MTSTDDRVFAALERLDAKLDQLNAILSAAVERLASIETWRTASASLEGRVRASEATLSELRGARDAARWLVPTLATLFGAAAGVISRFVWR